MWAASLRTSAIVSSSVRFALGPALDQCHGQLAASAAFPDELHLSPTGLLFDGDDHFADQGAQQLLAVSGGGRIRRPEARKVTDQTRQRLTLCWGERLGTTGLEFGQLASFTFPF